MSFFFFFFLRIRRPPRSPLFPSPPLSRSGVQAGIAAKGRLNLPAASAVTLHHARAAPSTSTAGPSRTPTSSDAAGDSPADRKSTRLNSSHANISYAVFCLKKKKKKQRVFI